MARRPITDDLLKLTIENMLETGVSNSRIRGLVEAFAADDLECGPAEEIVGFLWVEDIPADRRGTFLTALLSLSPEPELVVASVRKAAPRPAVGPSLLTRLRTVLPFASA